MLQIQTDNLPEDQRRLLHEDFLANEQAYLLMRESLLSQYRGQWVAVEGGIVIAAGPGLLQVMEKTSSLGGHPFIALVGAEEEAIFRVRRVMFAYDQAYQPYGHRLPALIQPITGGQERITGRDVLNQHRVLFDGPAGQVLVNP